MHYLTRAIATKLDVISNRMVPPDNFVPFRKKKKSFKSQIFGIEILTWSHMDQQVQNVP